MQKALELRYFLFSQQLADGVRVTAAIVLPAFILYQFGLLAIGFAFSLGALCVSITDAPGPIIHRRNAMLITTALIFIVSCITAFLRVNYYWLGLEIFFLSFFFSLFQIYGARAASIGSASILIMVLTMGRTASSHPLLQSLYMACGGFWYLLISLFFYYIRPYRPAQRVLGDCIREVAAYLSIKASFYNVQTNLDADYKNLVAQQIVVNEKQDAVREFFYKTARIVTESTSAGKKLVAVFVYTVDLFEDATATYYNYSTLRKRFDRSDILQHIAALATRLALELDKIGIAIQSNIKPVVNFNVDDAVTALKNRIDAVKKEEPEENTLVLKKILVNIRSIAQRIGHIYGYFDAGKKFAESGVDHSQFIGHQRLDVKLLRNNLNIKSVVFRYAVRVAVACLAGFVISKALAYGQHSYWILLTIAFILKPAFSLTKTRNIERIWGTVAGGLLGVAFLFLVKNTMFHFIAMVLLMIGAFTFMRTRYVVMVICTTAYLLIVFQFLDIPFITVVQERVFDTVLGCAIAFSAGYFLFPDREAQQIKKHMAEMLLANAVYLHKVTEGLEGKTVEAIDYKLARKNVYVQSANLSAAYQRMRAEPKRWQQDTRHTHQFIVRNHLLFSNVAHIAALSGGPAIHARSEPATIAKASIEKLYGLSKKLNPDIVLPSSNDSPLQYGLLQNAPAPADDALLQSGLQFIARLCSDIEKTTEAILAG